MSKRQVGSPGFLFVLALILIFTGINIYPSLFRYPSQVRAVRVACAGNLKNIGLGLKMYAADHDAIYPRRLVDAGRYLAYQPALFVCPSSGTTTGRFETVDEWLDYVYVKGLAESVPPDSVLMYCHPKNHGGVGGNVLFADGHVEWVDVAPSDKNARTFRQILDAVRAQAHR